MSFRKKIAKSLRSSFASVALAGAVITSPITGSYLAHEMIMPDFDAEITAESQERYQGYDQRAQELKTVLEKWRALKSSLGQQDDPDTVVAFVDKKNEIQNQFLTMAKELGADILTDRDLTETDYEKLEDYFNQFEQIDGLEYKNFYLPKEVSSYKEIQEEVFSNQVVKDKFAQASQVRQEMKATSFGGNLYLGLTGISIFGTVFMFVAGAGVGANRKLADIVERPLHKPKVKRN